MACMCRALEGMWEVFLPFGLFVQWLLVSKKAHLLCHWMHHHVLFPMERCVLAFVIQFVADQLFLILFHPLKIIVWFSLFLVFQLQSLLFLFLIFLALYFQFHQSISILNILFFPSWSLLLFFPWPVCKNFIGFKFHHLIQIYSIIFFNLVLIVLISNFSLSTFIKV